MVEPAAKAAGGTGMVEPAAKAAGGTGMVEPAAKAAGGTGMVEPAAKALGGTGMQEPAKLASETKPPLNPPMVKLRRPKVAATSTRTTAITRTLRILSGLSASLKRGC